MSDISNREKLEKLGCAILAASRSELYLSLRFLDFALGSLDYRMNLNTVSVGTDGVSILFNPTYLRRVYLEDLVELNRVYLHMVLHCLFRHELNRDGRDEELWGIACDIAVESILDSLEVPAVQLLPSVYREEVYDWLSGECPVLTAETIYQALTRRNTAAMDLPRLKGEFYRDDHQFWLPDEQAPKEQPRQDTSSSSGGSGRDEALRRELEVKWRHISQKTQTSLETFQLGYGKEAGALLRAVRIENRERYDYRTFLLRFTTLREEVRVDTDSFDYAFYSYGLRLYGNIPLIEPLEYQEARKIHDFVIVIDTSDSCSDGVIDRFLSETRAVLNQKSAFFREINLHIIQNDAAVQMDTVLHTPEEFDRFADHFTVRGFGGTDFRPAFDYVARLQAKGELRDLRGLLYFTDGFGAYPGKKPPYEVAFVFFQEDYCGAEVPPWAMKLILGPEEWAEDFPKPV